jgi:uncharacterized protein (DUF1501 family)
LRSKLAGYQHLVTDPTDPFSTQPALAAQIIGSGVGTRIIFVSIGSFDTHAGQRAQQDRLLGYLSQGLLAFYQDLDAHGLAGRVVTMTFSEFGRRVQQNAGNGTDRGTAMPLFVLGDLKFQTDFRTVYATVVARRLGLNPSNVVGGDFGTIAFV